VEGQTSFLDLVVDLVFGSFRRYIKVGFLIKIEILDNDDAWCF
jgi:hypothetical protein